MFTKRTVTFTAKEQLWTYSESDPLCGDFITEHGDSIQTTEVNEKIVLCKTYHQPTYLKEKPDRGV